MTNNPHNFSEKKTEPNTGRRIAAGLIDYLIVYCFAFLLIILIGDPTDDGGYKLSGIELLIPVLAWLVVTVIIECTIGATLGNSLVGLKAIPINRDLRNLTFFESLKRHLLDIVDMSFFGLVGIIAINSTNYNQRVGDLLAGTIVVKKKHL